MNIDNLINDSLRDLRDIFVENGFDIRLVGGCVRDFLIGVTPKDIDLCTNATPEQQIDIFTKHNIKFIETGLQHGTLTVVLDNTCFEITSLREDIETDGRHAKVAFTSDWINDLARRDLTINAMSITFGGHLIDPFNGHTDLQNKVVRFVGNSKKRIQEDYLRIMRFFRFHARFSDNDNFDQNAMNAIMSNHTGLKNISKERVWVEMKGILKATSGQTMSAMEFLFPVIDMPAGNLDNFKKIAQITNDPIIRLAAWLNSVTDAEKLADDWKMSNQERDFLVFMVTRKHDLTIDLFSLIAVDNHDKNKILMLATLQERFDEHQKIIDWVIPQFPVNGNDIKAIGMTPGKNFKNTLDKLKNVWKNSNYTATKDMLIATVKN